MLEREISRSINPNQRKPGRIKRRLTSSAKATTEKLLAHADVKIDGPDPWDIKVNSPDFYDLVLAGGSLALGETYMEGWWDCDQIDELTNRLLRADLKNKLRSWREELRVLQAKLINYQNRTRAFQVGKEHYDIGNELYSLMLDRNMIYSCGYWENSSSLDEAQEAKLDLICRKLRIMPGMKVLDIGCGWGGTARFIAEKYQAQVVGITISREQATLAREKSQGLPVKIQLTDYRNLQGKFDRILSIGMFEHVGYKNYKTFMNVVHNLLKEDGLFLLHTIGGNHSTSRIDPWVEKYIFPNANLPSIKQISTAIEKLFVMEDWHNLGPHYDPTLMAWFNRFNRNWLLLKERYGERFYRMWKFYLLSSAGSFRARYCHVWQVILSPKGVASSCPWPR